LLAIATQTLRGRKTRKRFERAEASLI